MKYLTIWIPLFITFSINAQTLNYSRIKVDLTQKSITELSNLGLALEHGVYKKGRFLINEFSNIEIDKIQEAGFNYEILIEDLDDFYRNQNTISTLEERSDNQCDESSVYDYNTPENFELGSFMGYLTYEELLENLDSMAAKYPDLISSRQPIDTFLTFENRPVYWLKISDNPQIDEEEPEALYTSLHHAREPMSLSSVIFYMWYLLENYESNPAIQYLIDNTELYFIPCVNPDGYIYNVANYQNGGSFLWRKNRRDNNDGTYGVDLNRNYGYKWGINDTGSSPSTISDTYRGTEAFSEPETTAIQSICNSHEFQICFNNHSRGNLLLIPWNYLDGVFIADPAFLTMSEKLVEENHYWAGSLFQTLNYTANGNADDWMYGENVSKPPIFAFTPEIGPYFFPSESQIITLCKSVLLQNLKSSFFLLNYGEVEDQTETIIADLETQFKFELTRYGLKDGILTVSISAISENILSVGTPKDYDLDSFSTVEDSIDFSLSDEISLGDEIVFLLSVDNGGFVLSDTITKIFHQTETIFTDNGDNLDQWDATIDPTHLWGLTSEEYYSETSSITDSPDGVYFSWQENYLEMDDPILLLDSTQSFLTFWAKWDIENDYDYAQISISTNGWAYTPLCGKYTNLGTEDQDDGEPLYDGEQLDWVKEEIDLSDFMGQEIYLRFSMISNAFNNGDGFYFDDLKIETLVDDIVAVESLDVTNFTIKTSPNPAAKYVNIEFSKSLKNGKLLVYNALGELVFTKNIQNKKGITLNSDHWNPGIYFCRIYNNSGTFITKRIVIVD
jgi:carboxypeptidase T